MGGSFTIARVGGIKIRLHITFLIVLPIIAFAFSRVFVNFREAAPMAGIPEDLVRGSPLFWGAMIAIALFASVLLHELAHAFVARRKGGAVRDITLLMIGGVSNVTRPVRSAKAEVLMALAGPVTSLVLAGAFFAAHLLLAGTSLYSLRFAFFYLGALNVVLGLFNLVPAFPMDGGRILRGALAGRMGNVRATQLAAKLGKGFALLFVVFAFLSFNLFLLLIAFFVYIGAEAEASQVLAQSVLGEVRVAELVRPAPPSVEPNASVESISALMVQQRQTAVLVRSGEEVRGAVVLEDVLRVPAERRAQLTAAELAHPAPAVAPSASVWDAVRSMAENRLPMVPVMDGPHLLGVLDHDDVVRSLKLHQLERRGEPIVRRREEAGGPHGPVGGQWAQGRT